MSNLCLFFQITQVQETVTCKPLLASFQINFPFAIIIKPNFSSLRISKTYISCSRLHQHSSRIINSSLSFTYCSVQFMINIKKMLNYTNGDKLTHFHKKKFIIFIYHLLVSGQIQTHHMHLYDLCESRFVTFLLSVLFVSNKINCLS